VRKEDPSSGDDITGPTIASSISRHRSLHRRRAAAQPHPPPGMAHQQGKHGRGWRNPWLAGWGCRGGAAARGGCRRESADLQLRPTACWPPKLLLAADPGEGGGRERERDVGGRRKGLPSCAPLHPVPRTTKKTLTEAFLATASDLQAW